MNTGWHKRYFLFSSLSSSFLRERRRRRRKGKNTTKEKAFAFSFV